MFFYQPFLKILSSIQYILDKDLYTDYYCEWAEPLIMLDIVYGPPLNAHI